MNFDNPDQYLVQLSAWIQAGLADNPVLAKCVGILLAAVPLATVFALIFAFTTWRSQPAAFYVELERGTHRVHGVTFIATRTIRRQATVEFLRRADRGGPLRFPPG